LTTMDLPVSQDHQHGSSPLDLLISRIGQAAFTDSS
jgi:hypothetical protein